MTILDGIALQNSYRLPIPTGMKRSVGRLPRIADATVRRHPLPAVSRTARWQQRLRSYGFDAALIAGIIIMAFGAGWVIHQRQDEAVPPQSVQVPAESSPQRGTSAQSAATTPSHTQSAGPRLIIPKLGISAPVQAVGKTASGAMDIPRGAWSVGWYQPGARWGNPGNAVIAGHAGAPNQNAVFKHLDALKVGDTVEVKDGGSTFVYQVTKTQTVTPDNAPLQAIFGASSKAHLNLITCHGLWANEDYSHRLVVYTDLIKS